MPRRRKQHTPGTLEKRGGSYRVHLCVDGERHKFTVRTTDKAKAEQAARDRYEELVREAERVAVGLPGSLPFSALLERYRRDVLPTKAKSTQATYGQSLDAFGRFFVDDLGDPGVHEVRQGHVRAFLTWRRTNPLHDSTKAQDGILSARSLAKDRAVLHAVFGYAVELELRDGNPVAKVKPPKGDPRTPVILDPDQYEALLAAAEHDPMLHTYALVLGETGMRCDSEALWLRWEDIDFESGFIRVESSRSKGRRTKSGKTRYVPMTPRLRRALQDHAAAFRMAAYRGQRSPWVFHHVRNRRRATAGNRLGSLRGAFDNAAKRAKLPPDLNQHDLRHRRVTTWLGDGKPAQLVQAAMGHSDIRTTQGYAHLVPEHLRALVDDEPDRDELRELGT